MVTACTVALPPYFAARFAEGFNRFVTSTAAPALPVGALAGCRYHVKSTALKTG
jgi:hypothetical protein